jgi:DNA repair exonuclease SbcCD ATPase subunit
MSKKDLESKIETMKKQLETMDSQAEGYQQLESDIAKLEQDLVAMPDDNDDTSDDTTNDDVDPVEAEVQKRLAKMKENMDRMARERDEALKEKNKIEQERKKAEIQRLEEEGKLKEAAEMKAADLEAKLKLLEEENTKLTRDSVLQASLAGLEFRNERSRQMAYRDIVDQLVQNETGSWVHKSGVSINDYVNSYSKEEDNSFLFRVKSNTGAGTNTSAGTPDTKQQKKLSEMSTAEVLKLAQTGQLGKFGY